MRHRPATLWLELLTRSTVVGTSLPLSQQYDGACAMHTGQALTAIHLGLQLEVPRHAICAGKVPQRRAPMLYRQRQRLTNGMKQPPGLDGTDGVGWCSRCNTAGKQHFRRIDIAHAHHQLATQQQLLDGCAAALQPMLKAWPAVALLVQRLHTQAIKQFACHRVVLALRGNHRTKAAWVMQTQHPAVCTHLKVVMLARWRQIRRKPQTA